MKRLFSLINVGICISIDDGIPADCRMWRRASLPLSWPLSLVVIRRRRTVPQLLSSHFSSQGWRCLNWWCLGYTDWKPGPSVTFPSTQICISVVFHSHDNHICLLTLLIHQRELRRSERTGELSFSKTKASALSLLLGGTIASVTTPK